MGVKKIEKMDKWLKCKSEKKEKGESVKIKLHPTPKLNSTVFVSWQAAHLYAINSFLNNFLRWKVLQVTASAQIVGWGLL